MSEPCWVSAHIIDAAMPASDGKTYQQISPNALDDVKPLGVAAVVITAAPHDSGFDPKSQTMVMLEFDPIALPRSEDNKAKFAARQAIERLQSHQVIPDGSTKEVAFEFGDSLIDTLQNEA